MIHLTDGPASPNFFPILFQGNISAKKTDVVVKMSEGMIQALEFAPHGPAVYWGIPFEIQGSLILADEPVTIKINPVKAHWLVFLHTSDLQRLESGKGGLISPMRGQGRLNEHAADYVMIYEDGSDVRAAIHRRHQIGTYNRFWGENCFQAVASRKPQPRPAAHEQLCPNWGWSQTRVVSPDFQPWTDWLWAWENPHPEKQIIGIRFEPVSGVTVISGMTAGNVTEQPLRWRTRRKAVFRLPEGVDFQPTLDEAGLLNQVQLDLGQVISAQPRAIYPVESWESTNKTQIPNLSKNEILVEYTAHPDACFHLGDGQVIPAVQAESGLSDFLQPVAHAVRRVTLKVFERGSSRPAAVKLHVHGQAGENLVPVDRHRIVNPNWFEDYSVDFINQYRHQCTYIPGETVIDIPLGKVYIEVSKGFEIRPVRKVIDILPDTEDIIVEIDRVLPWREKGWVTADTHVHFLSPVSALLEGAAEGVNVINLLASQWGELMTNVGDFDGKTTWGSKEAGGEGEYLVRVGSENRQHVLGHISLLGYSGRIIAPMTVGGPDESALGDPIDVLLTEWARQCHKQGGLVVLPHFPNPRAEHAASIVCGEIDAVEMSSWIYLYNGIDPYSLSDWYRYLNCGYLVPAVGGTDKMSADISVGAVRTYAHLQDDELFTYDAWMNAVRRKETFVTYGPLLEFFVEGFPMGSRMKMSSTGGRVDVTWQVASVTVPLSQVELVVNGEIYESAGVDPHQASGTWSVQVGRSAWMALLVRGQYPDQPEIIAAHSSPVMIDVDGSSLLAAGDAVTILEQIEGALAFIDTIGTRAEDQVYKRMRLELTSAHRNLHNRMHSNGAYHNHSLGTYLPEHHS